MLKYMLRYAPLLILVLLLVSLHFMEDNAQQADKASPSPVSQSGGTSSALFSIATLPDGDAWAVGGSFAVTPATSSTAQGFLVPSGGIILHYANNTWSSAQVDGMLQLPLYSVSLDSPQDGWAVGQAGTLVHYNGFKWSTRPDLANFKQNLFGVTMLSPTDGWAVGNQGTILHYRNGAWESVYPASYYQNPLSSQAVNFSGMVMNSIRSGWIVGGSHLLTYGSEAWIEPANIVEPSNALNNLNLSAIIMTSTGEGWAVGSIDGYNTTPHRPAGVILHYEAGKWNIALDLFFTPGLG